jgi:YHS domain-containing protein
MLNFKNSAPMGTQYYFCDEGKQQT